MNAGRLPILALAAGAVALGGCGSDNNGGGGGSSKASKPAAPATGGGQTVNLSETEFKITPAKASAAKTGKVTFKVRNDGKIVHALEVEGPGGEAKTGSIQPGKSATLQVTFSKAGTFELYCPIDGHKQQGMEGTVAVAGGGSGKVEKESDESGSSGSGKSSY
jgi:uncharacterized cupredoxin-like copper-binding protein